MLGFVKDETLWIAFISTCLRLYNVALTKVFGFFLCILNLYVSLRFCPTNLIVSVLTKIMGFFLYTLNFYFSLRFRPTNLIVNPKQSIHWNWFFQIKDFSPHSDTHITQVHTLTCVCVRTLFKPSCHKNTS